MDSEELDKLIKKDKYQVFIFTSLCSFPVTFARHAWFVVNNKGVISRWEIIYRRNLSKESWGHLYKNLLPFSKGMEWFHPSSGRRWNGRLLEVVEGDESSIARKMAEFIENSKETYPYNYKYHLVIGPNSNAYARWVLNHFPELKIKLPWNCFGKNYKKKSI